MAKVQAMLLNADGKFHYMHKCYRAIALANTNRVHVLYWWDDEYSVSTSSNFVRVPALIVYHKYIKMNPRNKPATLINENLFKRDSYVCQYCGNEFSRGKLSVDHVIPRAQNGKHHWTNCVTACKICNNRKGNRTPEQADMPLLSVPYVPKFCCAKPPSIKRIAGKIHESWLPFLDGGKEVKI